MTKRLRAGRFLITMKTFGYGAVYQPVACPSKHFAPPSHHPD
jgi:hypothetical protein